MKRFPKYLLISAITFFVGIIGVSVWFFSTQGCSSPSKQIIISQTETPTVELPVENNKTQNDFRAALDEIWLEDKKFSYEGYAIVKECTETAKVDDYKYCSLKIKSGKKILAEFIADYGLANWLRYGFFNLLGENHEQLIIFTYSGGAHCCYDYIIYDLKPDFHVIYDSRNFNGNIGNELITVDIDGDSVFEIRQDVTAFDYMSPGGHATSTFPPAVFSYDSKKKHYDFANKKFPDYVLDQLEKNLAGHDIWVKEAAKYGTHITQEELDEISVRHTFLYSVYAGKEEEGWKYFDENYDFQFREKFKEEFKEQFSKDITYKSIYKH